MTEPSFAFYRIAATIYGYDVVSVRPSTSPHIDLRRVAKAINEKTRVIFLCNPNNPTGTIFNDEAFAAFLDRLPPEVLVVVDEAYAEFAESSLFPRSRQLYRSIPGARIEDLFEGLRAGGTARRIRDSGRVARLLPREDQATLQRQHDGAYRRQGRI